MSSTNPQPDLDPPAELPPGVSDQAPVLLTDVWVSRRQRVHQVQDPTGRPLFTATYLLDAFDFLQESGFEEALLVLVLDNGKFRAQGISLTAPHPGEIYHG